MVGNFLHDDDLAKERLEFGKLAMTGDPIFEAVVDDFVTVAGNVGSTGVSFLLNFLHHLKGYC